MMCALEMTIAVEEAKRLEEIRKAEERKARYNEAVRKFYEDIESIDKYVEKALLEGGGTAELMFDNYWERERELGQFHFCSKDMCYKDRNGGYPYYCTKSETENFILDLYVDYLKSHCYKVTVTPCDFWGYSSTGKTKKKVNCYKMKISI